MGRSWVQSWTSLTLCVILSWMCVCRTEAGPQYTVAIPAILKSGEQSMCCVTLLHPNETLTVVVTMKSPEEDQTLYREMTGSGIDSCVLFEVASVESEEVRELEVLVQGDTFFSKETSKVLIRRYKPMTFVQTDKPIYLPGQKVNFRVVSMNPSFRPFNQTYSLIELEDPNSNRIGQWLNTTSNGTILQLSHALNPEAKEGAYRVIVSSGETKEFHTFRVKKYVLPKFETKLKAPKEVSIIQEEMEAEICAKYTFGQPVPGSATIKVCRPLNHYRYDLGVLDGASPPCHEETKQTDKSGCASFTIGMPYFKKLDQKVLQDSLRITASVEEEGTGVGHSDESTTHMSYVIGKLSFVEMPKVYHRETDMKGQVKFVHYNDTPIADTPVYLFEGERWASTLLQNLTTNSEGIATFTLPMGERMGDILLHASSQPATDFLTYRVPHYESGEHTVSMYQVSSPDTQTVSVLEVQRREGPIPCDQAEELSVNYVIVGEPAGSATLIYMVLARGAIAEKQVINIDVGDKLVTEGVVPIQLKVTPDMAPEVQVVAYLILPSEAVIAHSADFPTEKCFANKVSVEFSDTTALPGETSTMKVTANPNSLCGVSAIDQSVLIEEPGKMLDVDKIFRLLPVIKTSYIPHELEDPVRCLHVRPKRYIMPRPGNDAEDAYTVFRNVGLKVVTNLVTRVPSCLAYRGREYHYGRHFGYRYMDSYPSNRVQMVAMRGEAGPAGPVGAGSMGGGGSPPPIETVRTFFPETWIWDLVEVGDSGSADVSVSVPDSITTWETEAFCLSSEGFGLAPRKNITVYQPFFVELTMPYSIVRGEQFELKATTFNFLSDCILVSVSALPSPDFHLTPLSGNLYTSCLCGSERRTLSWTMSPVSLGKMNVTVKAEALPSQAACDNEIVKVPARGRVDVVTRTLIVKAEGTEMTENHNWLLCPKGAPLVEEVDIQLPANVIPGSAHASFSVLGDILGRAMQNLDGMLQMPYGCGEQNMALLAPNIYILQYLQNTQQLTPAIKEKASSFLTGGYQRQLNYKHSDGAYSTFGRGNGNTWLTAFVLRSFAKAQSFIYIDPSKIEESKAWLQDRQRENGCFEKIGKLFNNRMKGGVSDEVTLSAYITAGFLEMGMGADDPVVNKSLSCLRESMSDLSNTYTTALMAYVFTLAGDVETRHRLVQHLVKVSEDEGGFLHWSQTASETSASLSVEISSYVLLATISSGSVSVEDLGYASRIVRWLTKQQNHYGGFSSTQDTVVALQALALYSTLVYSRDGASTVIVKSPSGKMAFDVNQSNKLLYQEVPLQDVSGKFSLKVKGNACASMQISVHYNIPTPTMVSSLKVGALTRVNCSTTQRPKFSMVILAEYSGKENSSNMVILDIKLLSGFAPDPLTLNTLKNAPQVDRFERKEDHILIYLKELTKESPFALILSLVQEIPVENLKPALIKIYDYYQPTDQSETEYTYACASA